MNNCAIVNSVDSSSTGKIAIGLQSYLEENGVKTIFCYGYGNKSNNTNRFRSGNIISRFLHYIYIRLSGRICRSSTLPTIRMVRELKRHNVRNIFIINLHGNYLNDRILFNYILKENLNVVYIMADESAFLGNCMYRNGCTEYLNSCKSCPNTMFYQNIIGRNPSSQGFDFKAKVYNKLHAIFVAPEYVINEGRKSPLLQNCLTEILDEAIDVSKYSPRNTDSLKKELGISPDKTVIVCIAPYTEAQNRKGVKYFIESARQMESDSQFIFVHVGYGMNEKKTLPKNYIAKGYISDQEILAQYYSLADLFVFPSIEDTMPNACLEALACGSPLLCFNISGMPYIGDETVMKLVAPRNVDELVRVIKGTTKKTIEKINICRTYAVKRYDNKKYFAKLMSLMKKLELGEI